MIMIQQFILAAYYLLKHIILGLVEESQKSRPGQFTMVCEIYSVFNKKWEQNQKKK